MKIILFSLFIAMWIFPMITNVNALLDDKTLQMVKEYCVQHTSDILDGKNPIADLISAGLIYSWDFEGKTCSDVQSMRSSCWLVGCDDNDVLKDLLNSD